MAAATAASVIVQDDGEVTRERLDVALPERGDTAETGHEKQRRSGAVLFVVERLAVGELELRHG